jgi:hypothetical protein
MTVTIMIAAPLLSHFLPAVGVRVPMTVGPIVAASGLFWLSTFITVEGNFATQVLPGVVLLGLGLAMMFVPMQNVALSGIDEHDAGVASAAVSATQQIGGSIGTALFTALYTSAIASHLASNAPSATLQLEAFVSGYSAAFLWAAGLMLLASPIAFFLIRPAKADLLKNPDVVHMG